MRRFVLVLVLLSALISACDPPIQQPSSTGGGSSPAMPANLPRTSIVKVVDGDTVDVSLNGQTTRVRLLCINTPETVDPNRPIECYGPEASAKAKAILTGQTVLLESDSSQQDRDQYNRLLRYVWLSDGELFNLNMVSQGYAYEYTFNVPYKYQSQFKQAQQNAKSSQIGLWSPATCNGKK